LLRVRVSFLLVFLFSGAIIYRTFDIQWIEGQKWAKKGREIGLKFRKVRATRGNIYSDNGSLLATSVPFYKVAFDPTVARDQLFEGSIDTLALLLSQHFKDKSPGFYQRKIKNARAANKRYLVLNKQRIGYQEKKLMSEWPIFKEGRLRGGVIFEKVDKRLRPFSHLGSRTIGYINEDNYGAGLEYSFNKILAGRDGQALFQKMAGGNWKPVYHESEVRPVEGMDIVTTLDINLQDVAESALHRSLTNHDADFGCVVVMEVHSGEIKAISNLSKDRKGIYRETYNYAIASQGVREPGSTFKLVSLLALFEDSDLSLEDSIETGDGKYKFHNIWMRDHKPGGYGKITVKEAFEKSSNIAIAKMVVEHFGSEPSRFVDYIKNLGLAQPLGFQMAGEGKPYVKTPSDSSWSGISLPWISHGYEIKLSPLQTLTLYNAIANEGRMIRPIIVKEAKNADRIEMLYTTQVLNPRICSSETLAKLREMLEGVVKRGTARSISNSNYKIAGKTGTAQKFIKGRYSNKYYTSFVGYFPADRPKYSCIVVIDDPKGYRQYGADVAAPVFKEIADKIYARDIKMHQLYSKESHTQMGIFPVIRAGNKDELKFICDQLGISNHSQTDEEWVKTRRSNNSISWVANTQVSTLVPDVRGMTLRDALYLLENKGLKVGFKGSGRVKEQSKIPGRKIVPGSQINLRL